MKTNVRILSIENDALRLTGSPHRKASRAGGRLKGGHLLLSRAAFWIALFWIGLVAHSFAAGYIFSTIDYPATGYLTEVLGVDGTNTVGEFEDNIGNYHGFLANSSTNEQLDEVSGTTVAASTYAAGISGGNIVGYYIDSNGFDNGFLLTGTTYTTEDDPDASPGTYDNNGITGTLALGVSGSNIVGYYVDASGFDNGFLLSGTTYVTLDDTNGVDGTFATGVSGSTVVGYYYDVSDNPHGFLLSGTTYTTLDDPKGVNGTYAAGISGGTVVGYYYDGFDNANGFVYSISSGTYTDLDDPFGYETFANGVSGNNIVGDYYDNYTNNTYGFEYAISGSAYTVYNFPLPGTAESTNVGGISGSEIVGYYTDNYDITHGYIFNGKTYTELDVNTSGSNGLAAYATYATGVSNGTVVGWYQDDVDYEYHGFSYNGTTYTSYDNPLSYGYTFFYGIGGSKIVGDFYDYNAGAYVGCTVALGGTTYTTLYNPLSYSTSGQLAASYAEGTTGTSIVGYAYSGDRYIGYVYDGTKYTAISDPLATGTDGGNSGTAAYGISGDEIVGLYIGSDSIYHGFLDDKGKFTTIDDPLATGGYTEAVGISGSSIVGNFTEGSTHGFLASPLSTPDIAMDTDVGSYTAVLSGNSAATGYATLVIKKTGKVTVAGKLPDGQSFTAGGDLIKDGTTPQFTIDTVLNYPKTKYYNQFGQTEYYTQKGLLLGTVTFAAVTGSGELITTSGTVSKSGVISNFTGNLEWAYPPQSLSGNGPGSTTLSVLGSAYSDAGTALPGSGTVILSDYAALTVSGTTAFDTAGSIDSVSDDLSVTSSQNKLTLKLNKSTGVFQGSFIYPGETKPTSLSGVLFKDLDNTGTYLINGGGLFLGPNGPGGVEIISE